MVSYNRIFNDARRNARVRESQKIHWTLKGSQQEGNGKILNISSGGMLLETDTALEPNDQWILQFDSKRKENNFVPENGRLVWHKKRRPNQNRFLCGFKFVDPSQEDLTRLNQRVQRGIARERGLRQLNSVLNALLIMCIVALTAVIGWMANVIYQNLQDSSQHMSVVTDQQASLNRKVSAELVIVKEELNTTKKLYDESQAMLQSVNQELDSTKSILTQTEQMLAMANEQISQLKGEVITTQDLSKKQMAETTQAFEARMNELKKQNEDLSGELATVRERLRLFEGNVTDEAEGRQVITLLKDKLGVVKTKIKQFRVDALNLRIAAQKERDRIKSVIGNRGYFTRDGESVKVDEQKYNSVDNATMEELRNLDVAPAAAPQRKVDIDVKIVN